MIEYRILSPEVSESGSWQLEIRDVGSWIWTIEEMDTYGAALERALSEGYVPYKGDTNDR